MVHDYLQLLFDNGDRLNIFNVFVTTGFSVGDWAKLVGCEISALSIGDTAVEINFVGGESVRVGMSNNDYRGPEAMEYIRADGQRIVW